MSDVPVGSLLSGGVDSTIVTRLMRDDLPAPPQTFAIGFPEAAVDELAAARAAATALGFPLADLPVSERENLARRPAPITAFAAPTPTPSLPPLHPPPPPT